MLQNSDYIRALLVFIIAVIASSITSTGINKRTGLYANKIIPSLSQPPSWVFSLVWSILYILFAGAWIYNAMAARNNQNDQQAIRVDLLFGLGIFLNLAWVFVFFGYGDIFWSKIIIIAMVILSILTAYITWTFF
jgi:benzodiazapine receptor